MYNFDLEPYVASHSATVGPSAPILQDIQGGCWGLGSYLRLTSNGVTADEPCISTQLLYSDTVPMTQYQDVEHTPNSAIPSTSLDVDSLNNNGPPTSDYQPPSPPPMISAPEQKVSNKISDDSSCRRTKAPRLAKGRNPDKKGKQVRYKCNKCPGFIARSKGDLKRHNESLKHKPRSHACEAPLCGKKFTRVDALKRHMKNVHRPGKRARAK